VPRRYRNTFLVEAMAGLNMIDKMGFGILDMNLSQAKRYMPLLDHDVSNPQAVRTTVYGGVVDAAYTQLLMRNTGLPFTDVLALDRVQKKLAIPDEAAARLKRSGLIEGRKPSFHVSAAVAKVTAHQADYIRNRAQDDEFYAKLLTDYLGKFQQATRQEINQLLLAKLSDALSSQQKERKVGNLLSNLRRTSRIFNAGTRARPIWMLAKSKVP
jgi:ATP-dependent DNA helicase RecG